VARQRSAGPARPPAVPKEPLPEAAPAPAAAAPRKNLFQRMSPLGRVISGLVAGISFVTGIIAIVPIFTTDSTNFGSLRISAAPFGDQTEFAIPASADFASFPAGPRGTCTAGQRRWLTAHGHPITTRYLVDLRNIASSGPMLALKSFRPAGKAGSAATAVKVVCDPTGAGGAKVQAARLLVSDPAQVAYFDKSAFGQTENIPDSPLVWNLAPGETGQVVIDLYPTKAYAGRLVVTAVSGAEHRDVTIPFKPKSGISVPALVAGGMTYLRVDGALTCHRLEGGDEKSCRLTDVTSG
jgi:hypothetical protein